MAKRRRSTKKTIWSIVVLVCFAAVAVLALIYGQDLLDSRKAQQTEAQTRALYSRTITVGAVMDAPTSTATAADTAQPTNGAHLTADGNPGVSAAPPAATATPQPNAGPTAEPVPEPVFNPDYPPVQTPPPVQDDFLQLYGQNKHFVGWLTAGERIDYPVVWYKGNNDFYLHHDFFGKEDNNGTLFLNGNNRFFPANDVWLIHGHNMRGGGMFGTLTRFRQYDYLRRYPIVSFRTIYDAEPVYYVPIAGFDASMQEGSRGFFDVMQIEFQDDEAPAASAQATAAPSVTAGPTRRHSAALQAYLDKLQKKSLWDSPVDVNVDDSLLMLITCSYNHEDGRFMLVCRKLRDGETAEGVAALFEQEQPK